MLVWGVPDGGTLATLRARFQRAFAARALPDLEADRPRTLWYVSLVHFTGPVADPERLAAWCDRHAGTDVGTAELPAVEVAHAARDGDGVRLNTLERVAFRGRP